MSQLGRALVRAIPVALANAEPLKEQLAQEQAVAPQPHDLTPARPSSNDFKMVKNTSGMV